MRITNTHNLPLPIVSAVSMGLREPQKGQISVTELIDSPKIRALKIVHFHELEEDASDRIWALLGTATHSILERADTSNHLSEEKLVTEIDGYKVTGTPDLLGADGTLHDYKVVSVYSFLLGEKESWVNQLNAYAFLYRFHGFEVKKLQIVAILRDWMRSKANEPDYPSCPVLVKDVKIWSPAIAEAYINERLTLHRLADEGVITPCTSEERWERPTTFAIHKKGNKRAVRVLDTQEKADQYIAKLDDKHYIEVRPGASVRCLDYCQVRNFCDYAKSLLTKSETSV